MPLNLTIEYEKYLRLKKDYAKLQERVTALETAGRPIKETLDNLIADNHLESPEILNDVWVSVLGSHLVKFAALLGETK